MPLYTALLVKSKFRGKPLSFNYKSILVNFQKHDFVGLGDAIIFSSLFKILKYRFPNAKLFLLTNKNNKHLEVLWREHSYVDDFLIHPPVSAWYFLQWLRFYYTLSKSNFDLAIIQAHKSVVNKVSGSWFPVDPFLTKICGIKEIIGYYDRWPQDIVFSKIINQFGLSEGKPLASIPHWSDIALEYAIAVGITFEDHQHAIQGHIKFTKMPLAHKGDLMIAINPGGDKNFNRRWPLENFKALCVSLHQIYNPVIVLIGGKDEEQMRDKLVDDVLAEASQVKIVNLVPKNLNETLNYIAQSMIFIGNDTGTTHLAAAQGETDIIAIFGPTDATYWGPQSVNRNHQIVTLDIPCRPCDLLYEPIGHKDCHLTSNKHQCLKGLPVNQVLDAVDVALRTKINTVI